MKIKMIERIVFIRYVKNLKIDYF